MLEFLKKWWKLFVGFFGAVTLFFFGMRNKNQWREFHENSKKNLEGQLEAEKHAAEKLENRHREIDSEFDKAKKELGNDIKKKEEKLESDRRSEEDKVKSSSTAKAIADMFDAEHVEVKDD